MSSPARPFNLRAFVSLLAALAGLGLPATGIANHFLGFESLTPARHAWMSAHNALSILFIVSVAIHIWLNRMALWNHAKGAGQRIITLGREAILAGALVAFFLLLALAHVWHTVV